MFSLIKKNRLLSQRIFFLSLVAMTGCGRSALYQESIEIPCAWHTTLATETSDDITCLRWWEAFNDSLLNSLIEEAAFRNNDVNLAASQSKEKLLETVNGITSEIAQNYIQLRGLQQRLNTLQKNIALQSSLLSMGEGLLQQGFIDTFNQNENKSNLNSLWVQKTEIEVSIKKIIYHLSTLLNYAPDGLYELLNPTQELPEFPFEIPLDSPQDLVQRHPGIKEAKKTYEKTGNQQAFYSYQKKLLGVLEDVEVALASLLASEEKMSHAENTLRLKKESYQYTQDLFNREQKDALDILRAQQELLAQEDSIIQNKVELLTSYVNLYRALNTGWEVCCEIN